MDRLNVIRSVFATVRAEEDRLGLCMPCIVPVSENREWPELFGLPRNELGQVMYFGTGRQIAANLDLLLKEIGEQSFQIIDTQSWADQSMELVNTYRPFLESEGFDDQPVVIRTHRYSCFNGWLMRQRGCDSRPSMPKPEHEYLEASEDLRLNFNGSQGVVLKASKLRWSHASGTNTSTGFVKASQGHLVYRQGRPLTEMYTEKAGVAALSSEYGCLVKDGIYPASIPGLRRDPADGSLMASDVAILGVCRMKRNDGEGSARFSATSQELIFHLCRKTGAVEQILVKEQDAGGIYAHLADAERSPFWGYISRLGHKALLND